MKSFSQGISINRVNSTSGTSEIIKIPVIFHVILTTEQQLGFSMNQIKSQLDIINQDFQRKNTDTIQTPDNFKSVAGKMDINFVLATKAPNGNTMSTPGIEVITSPLNSFEMMDNTEVYKMISSWDTDRYLNVWIINPTQSKHLGYGTHPVLAVAKPLDGVTLNYRYVGLNNSIKYGSGRTMTHELGHYFGLYHVFGDDLSNCLNTTDFIDDTPPQIIPTETCPSSILIGCNVPTMFQNFMDYTNDPCMNLFTNGQVLVMNTILNVNKAGLINNTATEPSIVPPNARQAEIDSLNVIRRADSIARVQNPFVITSIDKEVKGFNAYQNGAKLIIELSGEFYNSDFVLSNITGQRIFSLSGSQELDMSGRLGVYIITVYNSTRRETKKLLLR